MQLSKIITLASRKVRLPLLAMERSLRATGCQLPLWVIPYNDEKFDLPPNAIWWEEPDFLEWIDRCGQRPVMRKYQATLTKMYQFIDTDAIFLENPELTLAGQTGWINSCGHWHNPDDATTPELRSVLKSSSTVWQQSVFNSGQFACESKLHTPASLKALCQTPIYRRILLDDPFHEQPGLNLLAHLSGVPITNLTLPPHAMQSTWAGDYPDEEFEKYWQDEARKPYLLHWAGRKMDGSSPIDRLALDFLTKEERTQWQEQLARLPKPGSAQRLRRSLRVGWHALKASWGK